MNASYAKVLVVAVAVALVLVGVAASPAGAHGADAGVRYRLTGVLDTGRALLRIGPDGVQADVASASWQASDRPFGLGEQGTASSGEARWVHVSDESSWGWYDHRLHAIELVAPPDADGPVVLTPWTVPLRVGGAAARITGEEFLRLVDGQVLSSWAVPIEVDGEPASIVGELRCVGTAPAAGAGDGGLPLVNVALAAAGLATIAALVLVRRRSAGRRGSARHVAASQ